MKSRWGDKEIYFATAKAHQPATPAPSYFSLDFTRTWCRKVTTERDARGCTEPARSRGETTKENALMAKKAKKADKKKGK